MYVYIYITQYYYHTTIIRISTYILLDLPRNKITIWLSRLLFVPRDLRAILILRVLRRIFPQNRVAVVRISGSESRPDGIPFSTPRGGERDITRVKVPSTFRRFPLQPSARSRVVRGSGSPIVSSIAADLKFSGDDDGVLN